MHVNNQPDRPAAPAARPSAARSPGPPPEGSAPDTGLARVATLAREWLPDVPILVERYLTQVHQIGDYRDHSVPEESLREYADGSMALLLHLTAGEPVPDRLAQVSATVGRDRARRGIPLEALVRALQLNFRIVWDALLERAGPRDTDKLLECGPLVWEAVGTHLTRAVSGYQQIVSEMARERQDSRRAAFAALVESEGADAPAVSHAAAILSLDAAARFAVVAAAPSAGPGLRAAAAEVRTRGAVSYHQESPTDDVLIIQLPARLAEPPDEWLGDTDCAVGPIAHGLEQIPASLALATAMLRLPRRGAIGPLRLRAVWLGLLALHSAEIMPLLVADVLGPFASPADPEAARILEAVRTYLEAGGSVTHAAGRLYCHRNTLVNRIRRFTQITGRDIRQPTDAAVVLVALHQQPAPTASGTRSGPLRHARRRLPA